MLLSSSFLDIFEVSSLYITFFYCDGWPHDSYLFGCFLFAGLCSEVGQSSPTRLEDGVPHWFEIIFISIFYYTIYSIFFPQRMWRLFYIASSFSSGTPVIGMLGLMCLSSTSIILSKQFYTFSVHFDFFLEIYAEDNNSM